MSNLTRLILLCVLSVFCLNVQASTEALKIGVVNTQAFADSLYYKAARERIDKEFKGRKEALEAKQKDIKTRHEAFGRDREIMAEAERAKKERELRKLQKDFQSMAEELDLDYKNRAQEELVKFQKLVDSVIAEIAEAESFDLILPQEVVIFSNSDKVNCTTKVVKVLDKKFKQTKG